MEPPLNNVWTGSAISAVKYLGYAQKSIKTKKESK